MATDTVDLDGSPVDQPASHVQEAAPSVKVDDIDIKGAAGVQQDITPSAEEEARFSQALSVEAPTNEQKPSEVEAKEVDKSHIHLTTSEVDEKAIFSLGADEFKINQLVMGKYDPKNIEECLKTLYPTEEERQKAADDPTSFMRFVVDAARNGWGTNGMSAYLDVLRQVDKTGKSIVERLEAQNDAINSFKDSFKTEVPHKAVDLTAEESRKAFLGRINGYKRVKLLNSGFWVALRRPYIHELQDMFDVVDLEQKEIGYTIGPHFALLADMYVKKTFLEMLIKFRLIVESNLEGIYEDGVFMSALSFHDYEPLLQALLSLMSRNGLRARVVCPECNTVTMLENIDIGSAKFINRNLVTPAMTEWWDAKTKPDGSPIGKRTVKDCLHYQNDILGFKSSYVDEFNGVKVKIDYSVPTFKRYIEVGEILFNVIRDTINERSTSDKTRRQLIFANMAAHVYHMMAPWVSKLEMLEGDEVTMRTSDPTTVIQLFDTTAQERSEKAFEEMHKFLGESKISYIGTFALECPKCHARPDVGLKNQFYPLEVQTIFFGQLYRLLPAELTQMEQS